VFARIRTLAVVPVCCGLVFLGPTAPAIGRGASDEAASLAQQEGISLEQAERDLQLQGRAENIADELKSQLGVDYAGLWFDLKNAKFHVDVTSAADRVIAEEVTANDGVTNATDFDPVVHTWHELEAAEATLNSQLSSLRAKQQGLIAIDPRTNSITISVASDAAPGAVMQADTMATSAEVATTVVPVAPQSLQIVATGCSFPYCNSPQRGGVRINSESNGSGEYHICTAGFVVKSTATSAPTILTAGHCFEPEGGVLSKPWKTTECVLPVLSHVLGGGKDAGLVAAPPVGKCSTEYDIASWGKNESLPITGEASVYYGKYLCHEGAASGSQCGSVMYSNVTTEINYSKEGRGTLSIEHTDWMCAEGIAGDSGGPWATWNTEPPTEARATDIDLAGNEKSCSEGGVSVGYELHYALEATNSYLVP